MKNKKMKSILCSVVTLSLLLIPQIVFAKTPGSTASSGTLDPSVISTPFASLSNLVGTILSTIGEIITLWGVGEWGMAYQSNEGSMQAQSFKRIAGGLIMVLAPQILPILIG